MTNHRASITNSGGEKLLEDIDIYVNEETDSGGWKRWDGYFELKNPSGLPFPKPEDWKLRIVLDDGREGEILITNQDFSFEVTKGTDVTVNFQGTGPLE